jgi:pyrimidine-nucleoside phosphorylase
LSPHVGVAFAAGAAFEVAVGVGVEVGVGVGVEVGVEVEVEVGVEVEVEVGVAVPADSFVAATSSFEHAARLAITIAATTTSAPFMGRHDSNAEARGAMARVERALRSLVEIIASKRDGEHLADSDIARLIDALMTGALADYQMAAWLMAVFFRGLDDAETSALTDAMLRSGRVLDLSAIPGVKVDKHSTGGVGDKVSIALAPLVAACGVPVPMVSGRGLGHTGGTLDKLEAIPGFRTQLSADDFTRIVRDVGCCMMGQTAEIAPADKRIYALRDVTATVECIPLIVASILSKKLAEGIDVLVLDVKVGRGAFMKDEATARALAQGLVRVGTRAGKRVVALLTDMDAPMGAAVGNAVETREAFDVLAGGGPPDLVECTMRLGTEMLVLSGKATGATEARAQLANAIANGAAIRVAEKMVEAQGGDARVVTNAFAMDVAPEEIVIEAPREGFVVRADALAIGLAAVSMGAGRTRADQAVDHGVGIFVEKKPGARVGRGEALARLRVRHRTRAQSIVERVRDAFTVGDAPPPPRPLVLGRVDTNSTSERTSG